MAGATEVAVADRDAIVEKIDEGNLHRTTSATNCNEVSSRSHAVVQILVERTDR